MVRDTCAEDEEDVGDEEFASLCSDCKLGRHIWERYEAKGLCPEVMFELQAL